MRTSQNKLELKKKNKLKVNSNNDLENRESNQFGQFFEQLQSYQQYYIEIFPFLIKSLQRPRVISFLLILISQLQEAALIINKMETITNDTQSQNVILFYLNKTIGKQMFDGALGVSQGIATVVLICTAINLFIVLSVGITILIYIFARKEKKTIIFITQFSAFFCSFYNYIIYTPAINLSFLIMSDQNSYPETQICAYINLPLTLIIGMSITYHDSDYSFIRKDYLAKREGKLDILRQFILGVICLLNVYVNEKVLVVIIFIYSIMKLILYYREQFFLRKHISCLYVILCCAYCSFTLLMTINYYFQEIQNLGVLLLLQLGLSTRLGYDIYSRYQQNLFSLCMGKTDLSFLPQHQVDIFVRQLNENLSFFFEDYIEKGQALIFESIYISHKLNCDAKDYKCFCYEFQRDENSFSLEEYIGQEYRRKFVFQYIASVYEKIVNSQQSSSSENFTMLSYISYLFEIMNISTKSYSVIYSYQSRIFSRIGLSLKGIQSLNIIFGRLNKNFEHFFNNPKLQNQRIQMMSVINFDDYIQVFKGQTRQYLINLGEYYDYLCSNSISLQELEKRSTFLLSEYQETQKLQKWLFDINPDEKQLLYLTAIYVNVFDFQNRKVSDFILKSQRTTERFIFPAERNLLKLFKPNSCVMYASLNQQGGVIKRVSKSFSNIFEFQNQTIINKSISQIVPRGIYSDHDDFVNNFRSKGTMAIISSGERMVFGHNAKGFIFPLMIRLKLENILGELGVCAQLTKIIDINDFIFMDGKGQITDMTEDLYLNIFSQAYSKNQTAHLNVSQIIPITMIMKQLQEYNLIFQSIMIIPKQKNSKSSKQISTSLSLSKIEAVKNLEDYIETLSEKYIIFSVDVQIKQINTVIGKQYEFLEISHIQRIYGFDEKKQFLDKLKECVKVFDEYDKTNANGKTFNELNNLRFEQLRKLDQLQSQTKLEAAKDNETQQTVDSFFNTEEAISEDISIRKKQNQQVKRSHTNEKDLIQFANIVLSQNFSHQSPTLITQNQNLLPFHEKQEEIGNNAYRAFNLELTKIPYQEEIQSQDIQQLYFQQDQQDLQAPFSPKEYSHRQFLIPNSNDVMSQGDDDLFNQNSPQENKVSSTSNEIKSKYGLEQEQQTASRTNYNISQIKKTQSQKSQKSFRRRETRKKTTKLMIKKYEATLKHLENSSDGFSQDKNGINQIENDRDMQSLRSSNVSMNEQKKKQIINKISSQSDSFVVKIFITAVLLSFLILICVSSIQYKELTTSIDTYYQDFEQLNIFNQINDINLIILSQKSLLDLFSECSKIKEITPNKTFLSTEITKSNLYLNQQREEYRLKQMRTLNADSFQDYYNVFLTNTTTLNMTNVALDDGKYYNKNVTIIYEILIYRQQIDEMLRQHNLDSPTDFIATRLDFFWDNYYRIFKSSYAVQGVIEAQVKKEFDYIDKLQLTNLIVLLIVVVILVFSVTPMNIIGQMQIERILKLFGSFQPDKLQKYIDLIEYCIVKIDEMQAMNSFFYKHLEDIIKQHINQILTISEQNQDEQSKTFEETQRMRFQKMISAEKLNIIRRLPNKRNRQLASFDKLKKVNFVILGVSLIAILVLMIYPVVSLLIIATYKNEGQLVIQERISIFDASSVILDFHANHYGYWLANYRKTQAPSTHANYRINQIFDNIKSLHESSDSFFQKVSDIVSNQNVGRKNESKYKTIFLEMLNKDICKIVKEYPRYFNEQISEVNCESLSNGILNRGFIITMKELSQYFSGFLQIYSSLENSPNYSDDLIRGLIDLQGLSNTIDSYNQLLRIFKSISIALDNYIIESQLDYYHYITKINQNLFIMQIIIIILTFLFGWTFFYKKFTSKLKSTKDLLKLFHINLIVDNQIFMGFFKKNKYSIT